MTKVNIIIPTYNRPSYLKRLLDYYSGYNVDYNIIVADSSSDENKALNKKTISSFPNLKILYLGDYPDKINPWHKLIDAINYAKTKYCLFCADDDFITPNGINQSVDFLEKNPDFTIAQGRHTLFSVKDKKRRGKQFYWRTYASYDRSLTSSDPKVRLFKQLSETSTTFYGVHRTDFLKMIFREKMKYTTSNHFDELLLSVLTLIHGKMKCLNILYGAREINPKPAGKTGKNIYDLIKEGSYDEQYTKFKNCLAIHLNKKSGLDIELSKGVVDNAMSVYVKEKYYPFSYKRFLVNKMKYILDSLHTPDWIYNKIRLLHKKLFLSQKPDIFPLPLDDPSSKYYDDAYRIKTQVMSNLNN
jgi:glycosyltransferase domain-containing protein